MMLCFGTNSGCCDLAHVERTAGRIRWDILSLECVWSEEDNGIGAQQPLDTGDEMLFASGDLILQAIRLKVPEVNITSVPGTLIATERTTGIPKLRSPTSFEPRLMQVRHYDWKGDVLSVLIHLPPQKKTWRVDVHPSLSILAQGSEAVGWRLEQASTYIASPVSGTMPTVPGTGTEQQRRLLGKFVNTVDDAFVQRMEERDPAARRTLTALLGEAAKHQDNAVSEVLQDWIPDILDRFY